MDENKQKGLELSIPMAIIVAGVFISFSIYLTKVPVDGVAAVGDPKQNQIEPAKPTEITLRPVTSGDHIRGSQDAPVKVISYSDVECPFCKRFHGELQKMMTTYGKDNKVAWVYRSFPLDSLHPKSRKESEALECANELGGNDKFWAYLDRLMEITPSNNQLAPDQLGVIAEYVNLDKNKFEICLNSGRYAKKVQADVDDAISAGGQGTPYSVVVTANGKRFPVDGAVSYESLSAILDKALQEK